MTQFKRWGGSVCGLYCRIHGEVSREPARWRRVAAVQQQELRDVLYDKAVGEGIAKVSA